MDSEAYEISELTFLLQHSKKQNSQFSCVGQVAKYWRYWSFKLILTQIPGPWYKIRKYNDWMYQKILKLANETKTTEIYFDLHLQNSKGLHQSNDIRNLTTQPISL